MPTAQHLLFTVAVTVISRLFLLRDTLNGRLRTARSTPITGCTLARHTISVGRNALAAVFVQPALRPAHASLLLCHGIGETVEHWRPVQRLLALEGVASLIFDYSGFGRSTGLIRTQHCERDAIAAFNHLRQLTPTLPTSILGFSLGSGIASTILPLIPAHHLILCAAFTSLQQAAGRVGIPPFLTPPVWNTEQALRTCTTPVLLLHGTADRLLPARMARDLHAACASTAHLVLIPRLSHDEPYANPQHSYWSLVATYLGSHGSPSL